MPTDEPAGRLGHDSSITKYSIGMVRQLADFFYYEQHRELYVIQAIAQGQRLIKAGFQLQLECAVILLAVSSTRTTRLEQSTLYMQLVRTGHRSRSRS